MRQQETWNANNGVYIASFLTGDYSNKTRDNIGYSIESISYNNGNLSEDASLSLNWVPNRLDGPQDITIVVNREDDSPIIRELYGIRLYDETGFEIPWYRAVTDKVYPITIGGLSDWVDMNHLEKKE